jgi:hypothetical protein
MWFHPLLDGYDRYMETKSGVNDSHPTQKTSSTIGVGNLDMHAQIL